MEKSKSNSVTKGAIILLFAGVLCKLLGAFYRIPLSNILGTEGIGVYQLVFPIYSLFLILVSGGITTTLSKIIAECRAVGAEFRAKNFLKIAFVFTLIVSSIIAILFIIFSKQISKIQGNLMASLGYIAISFAVIFSSLITVLRGYFQGFQDMSPTAFSQVIEQVVKLIIGLLLSNLLLKYGLNYAVFGALFGITISEAISLLYLFVVYKKNKIAIQIGLKSDWKKDMKIFFKNLFPISLNSFLLPLIVAIDSILVINLLLKGGHSQAEATKLFGIYSGMINSVISFPTIFALSISSAILPSIASKNNENIQKEINTSFKFIYFIVIPCIFVYMLFASNIISILYSSSLSIYEFTIAKNLLMLSSINIFTLSYLQITTSILQAQNKSYISLLNLALASVLKLGLTIYLTTTSFGVFGACMASILCYSLACFLNYNYLCGFFKNTGAIAYVKITIISALVSLIMLGVYAGCNVFISPNFSFIISGVVAVILYLLFSFKLKVFYVEELEKVPLINKFKIKS